MDFFKSIYLHIKNAVLNYYISTLAVLFLFVLSEYAFYHGYLDNFENYHLYIRYVLAIIFFILFSISIHNLKFKYYYKLPLFLIFFAISYLFFSYLPNIYTLSNTDFYLLFSVFFIAILSIFVSGYDKENITFTKYVLNTCESFLKSIIVTSILLGVGYAFLVASKFLYKININKEYYFQLFFIIGILFFWIYLIGGIRTEFKDKNSPNKFFIQYISIPFVLIFFIILTIYDTKLIFNSNWPSNQITLFIISFLILGYFIYIVSSDSEDFSFYRKIFPFLALIQIPILGTSIYLRVSEYGFTFNRYLITSISIFFLLISLYLIISKKKHIVVFFILAIILISLTNTGTWSINNLPKNEQENRLLNILKTNNLLTGTYIDKNKLQATNDSVKYKVYKKLEYLCLYHGCKNIKVTKNITNNIKSGPNREILYYITNKLGLNKISKMQVYKYFHIINPKYDNNVDVFGYSYLIYVQNEKYKQFKHNGYYVTIDNNGYIYFYEDKKLIGKNKIPEKTLKLLYENNIQLLQPVEIILRIKNYELKVLLYSFELQKINGKYKFHHIQKAFALLKQI